MKKTAISQEVVFGVLVVRWSNGSTSRFSVVDLGVQWIQMGSDSFHSMHGFDFNPYNYPGLYEQCRQIVYPQDN